MLHTDAILYSTSGADAWMVLYSLLRVLAC
jgi:hypothetical protein